MSEPTDRQKTADVISKNIIKFVLDSEDRLEKVDAWITAHAPAIDRPEAIRRLVDLGLKAKK
jgi:hypothetical protein